MSEERFQELEEKLAFFEMTNAELGDEIFRQKKEIDTLTKAHRKLLQRIESLQDTVDQGDQEEGERPPHYLPETCAVTRIKLENRGLKCQI